MEEAETSITHLKTIADAMNPQIYHRFEQLELERKARQDELASTVTISDDFADYPINLLPMAHLSAVFEGRDEILSEIDAALDGEKSELRSVLLHGMGGVGKTQTALNYAHRNAYKYDAVFWVRSETTLSINASMSDIARALKLPGSMREDGNDEMNFLAVQSWFRTQASCKPGRKWLMIFDNVERIKDINSKYIPTSSGDIIITSRGSRTGLAYSSIIRLRPFVIKTAIQVLLGSLEYSAIQVVSKADEDAIGTLATKVAGLPIGLRVIAGLMKATARKNTSASKFLEIYNKSAAELMKNSGRILDYEGDSSGRLGSEHVLNRIWYMSVQSLNSIEEDGPERQTVKALLGNLALLCPDGVPKSLFGSENAFNDPPEDLLLLCEDDIGLDTAIVDLGQMGLVDIDGMKITMHRLVQGTYINFLLDNDKPRLEAAFASAVHILNHQFPRQINGRPMHGDWQKCRDLIEHAQWLAEHFSDVRAIKKGFPIPKNLPELLKHCAWYLFETADHRSALKMLDIAQSACEDKSSDLYAHLLNTTGCCAFELNDLRRCRQTWVEALSVREAWAKKAVPGAEEELANQLNNFGNLESAEGNYDAALELFTRAKEIRVKLGEDAIVPLAVSHMTTGRAYFLKGDPVEAMHHYKNAEAIFLDKFGPKAHFLAHLNYAYGNLKLDQFPEIANDFYEKARIILEYSAPRHLLLAACMYKIAGIRFRFGERAAALYDQYSVLEDKSPDTNVSLTSELIERGLVIAEFRDAVGDTARLLRKKAMILSKGTEGEKQKANLLIAQVESMLVRQGMNAISLENEAEQEWNEWVCPYWR